MAKKGKFVYRGDERTAESIMREAKRGGGVYDSYLLSDARLLKIREGESVVRIMPPSWAKEDDAKWGKGWAIRVFLHYSVGPDNATYLCLDKMRGEKCPVCEARRKSSDDERDALKLSVRFLCWAVDRNDEKAGPQVWSMPPTVFQEVATRSVDKKHGNPIPVDSPDKGYDVIFAKEGAGLKTKYSAFEVDRDSTPLHDDERQQERWLDYISEHPLPEILNFYEADHIEGVLFGKSASRDDDDSGGSKSNRRSGGRSSSSRDEEEKDYLEGDDEEEREERDAPRGGKTNRPKREEEPEEEDDRSERTNTRRRAEREEEPEEEEEERDDRPARGSRSSGSGARRPARDEEEPEEEEPEEEVEEEREERAGKSPRGSSKRRGAREEDPEEEPDDEVEEDATESARGRVARMSTRRRRARR